MPVEIEAPDGSVVEYPDGTPDDVIAASMAQVFGGGRAAESEVVKGGFLPVSRNTKTGEVSFDPTAGIIGSLTDAVTLPGRVMKGEVDPNSEEAIGDVLNLASVATPVPAAAKAASTAAKAVKPKKIAIPEVDEIKAAAQAAYSRAEDAGLVVSQQGFGNMSLDIARRVKDAGFNRKIHPKVTAALEEMSRTVGKEPTLKEMDIFRRVVQAAAKSNEPDERRIAGIMINRIDDFIENLSGRQVSAGDAKAGAEALREARGLWATHRKSQAIEELYERAANKVGANYTSAGFQTALRQEFKFLLQNKKAIRGFTPDERKAITKVVRGGKVENLFRHIGKFAPRGIVSTTLGGGAGFAAGGPVGAGIVMGVGEVGRQASNQLARRAANKARELVRTGPQNTKAAEQTVKRSRRLLDALLGEKPATVTGVSAVTGQS